MTPGTLTCIAELGFAPFEYMDETTGEAAVLEGDDRIFADVAAARGIVDHDVIQTAES